MTIKAIRAKSGDCQTEDVYRLLVLTHRMAGAWLARRLADGVYQKQQHLMILF
jgi:hypothetical protein